ncbi:MAG: hypothetical protein KF845_10415 [Cyclobacteriaceae bacterium]|nr:hypothetical protein [Cyclobacteriaceae bacterium]
MKVTHTKSNVIQYNEYYPFGLQTNTSWTRENTYGNAYLYNEGSELNSTTGWYEMFYRGYDAALGRMFEVDPFASDFMSLSPYHYVGNNPALLTDPSGGSTPELRELTAMINTPGFFDVWIPGNGIFGHVGPGSRHHWSDNIYRSPEAQQLRDYFLMPSSGFVSKYNQSIESYQIEQGSERVRNRFLRYYNRLIPSPGTTFESWLKKQAQGWPTRRELHEMFDESFEMYSKSLQQKILDQGWNGRYGQLMAFNEVYKSGYYNVLEAKLKEGQAYQWQIDLTRVNVAVGRVDLQTPSNPFGFVSGIDSRFGETGFDIGNYYHQVSWIKIFDAGNGDTIIVGWTFSPLAPK